MIHLLTWYVSRKKSMGAVLPSYSDIFLFNVAEEVAPILR
jgi:hypothetical protein